MALFRGIDDPDPRSEPDAPVGAQEELRRAERTRTLAIGTLACGRCDAPVALAGATVGLTEPLTCPFCLHSAPVRDFLSLAGPPRPARVAVKLVARGQRPSRVRATQGS